MKRSGLPFPDIMERSGLPFPIIMERSRLPSPFIMERSRLPFPDIMERSGLPFPIIHGTLRTSLSLFQSMNLQLGLCSLRLCLLLWIVMQ